MRVDDESVRSEHDAAFAQEPFDTLTERLAQHLAQTIESHGLRPGTRMPSVRKLADEQRVSRHTVVAAYDRLVARGLVVSRQGAGFFVRQRGAAPVAASERLSDSVWASPFVEHDDSGAGLPSSVLQQTQVAYQVSKPGVSMAGLGAERDHGQAPTVDVVWLLRSILKQSGPGDMPGSGTIPKSWFDADWIAAAVRSVARASGSAWLEYGSPQGYLPLREQLSLRLDDLGVKATPAQILTTTGVTGALDLVIRGFVQPGDTVLVEDPAWYLLFARLSALGIQTLGVPRHADGLDLPVLQALAQAHRPKLLILNSVLHNPIGTTLSAAQCFQILKLADQFGFHIVEDDVYGDLHPQAGVAPPARLASLDQLNRVLYLAGFAKTLAPNLRVGFVAAAPAIIQRLTDLKLITQLSSTELGERVVYRVLSDGGYRKHLERLRTRIATARELLIRRLQHAGAEVFDASGSGGSAGLFVWADVFRDASTLAAQAAAHGIVSAPGSLFSPRQVPSTLMRFSVGCADNDLALDFLLSRLGSR